MFKIIQFNSIHNTGSNIEYNYNIIKVTTSYCKAVEIALQLKLKTGKLYKIERV